MLSKGETTTFLGNVRGINIKRWYEAKVLDVSECERYVKLEARPGWGRINRRFWCKMSDVEWAFKNAKNTPKN